MRLRAGILLSAIVGSALPFILGGAADAGIVCNTVHTTATCDAEREVEHELADPPPANDNFADAAAVSGFPKTASGTTLAATVETGEPAMCAASSATVWYKWTSDADRAVAIDTFLSGTNTVLAVHTGSALNDLDSIGCNDDMANAGGPTTASEVNFDATSGTTYYIQVGYTQGNGRLVTLHVTTPRPPAPANDNPIGAFEIGALPFATTQDTRGATYTSGENTPSGPAGTLLGDTNCGSMLGTVWYKLTATEAATLQANTAGSMQSGDPLSGALAVWRQDADGRTLVACNFDTITGKGTITASQPPAPTQSQSYDVTDVFTPAGAPVLFQVEAGATYYIQTGGSFGGSGENLNLNVDNAG